MPSALPTTPPTNVRTAPPMVPTTPAPTPTVLTFERTYFATELALSLDPMYSSNPSILMSDSGKKIIQETVIQVLTKPIGQIGVKPQGIQVENIQILNAFSGAEEISSIHRIRELQSKTGATPSPSTSYPTSSVYSIPTSTFNLTFTMSSPSLKFRASLFSSTTSKARLDIARTLDSIIPVMSIIARNITYIPGSASDQCTGTSCSVTVTYQIAFNYGQAFTSAPKCSNSNLCFAYLKSVIGPAMRISCKTPGSCFQPSIAGNTKIAVLSNVNSVSGVTFSGLAEVYSPTPAPTMTAPILATTPSQSPTMQPIPTTNPTSGDVKITVGFTIVFNWGKANCVNRNNCFDILKALLSTSMTTNDFVDELNVLAKRDNIPWGQSVHQASNINFPPCNDKSTDALCFTVFTPAPTPVSVPVSSEPTRPEDSPTAIAAVSDAKRKSFMSQLPLIGGVVGGAIILLILLSLYMVYGRKKDVVIEEHEAYDNPLAAEHQEALDAYEQQRSDDDFRERESGGVDVLFNPAHQQYNVQNYRSSPNQSPSVGGFMPPVLPPQAQRRITLTRPKPASVQMHSNMSDAGSIQSLPAARRITIIAKPPLGGSSIAQQGYSPGLSERKGMGGSPLPKSEQFSVSAPPVGSMRPIGKFNAKGGLQASMDHARINYDDL